MAGCDSVGSVDDASVDTEATWPYIPADDPSWCQTHASIRVDMDDFKQAITAMRRRCIAGKQLEEWEKANLSMWWKRFLRTFQAHHSYEEEFLFPWLATRAGDDPLELLSDDHDSLTVALENSSRAVTKVMWTMESDDSALELGKLKSNFLKFQTMCLKHFEEEEKICVPLMRTHFSYQEATQVMFDTLTRTMTPEDMAEILRPMTKEDRKSFFSMGHISKFKEKLVLLPACKKYDKMYTAALRDLITGKSTSKHGRRSIDANRRASMDIDAGDLDGRRQTSTFSMFKNAHCEADDDGDSVHSAAASTASNSSRFSNLTNKIATSMSGGKEKSLEGGGKEKVKTKEKKKKEGSLFDLFNYRSSLYDENAYETHQREWHLVDNNAFCYGAAP